MGKHLTEDVTAKLAGKTFPTPGASEDGKFLKYVHTTNEFVFAPAGSNFSGTLDDVPDGTTYKRVTQTEKNTWNSKANGTHTHAISDITNLQTTLDGKASVTHNHNLNDLAEKSYNSLTDKPDLSSLSYDIITAMRQTPFIYTDFLGAAGAATLEAHIPFDVVLISSGTQAKIAGEPNHPGILRISSSTTANSGGSVLTDTSAFLLSGNEFFELIFQHRVASGTNTTLRFGYLDTTTSSDAVDGAYFEVPAGSLNLVGKTASNSARSSTGTSYTLTINTWYRARLVLNDNATLVTFYLYDDNGTLLWTNTLATNIPTASGRETGAGLVVTNAGTTATLLAYFDYMAAGYSGNRKLTR